MAPKKTTEPAADLLSTAPDDTQVVNGELSLVDHQGAVVVQQTPTQRAVIAFDSTKTERELKRLVRSTKDIIEIKNKDGRAQVHTAAQVLLKKRTGMKSKADELTEDAKAYTKAVKTESDRLTAITSTEETRLFKLRDDYDERERIEAERLARLEAERKERINTELSNIREHGTYAQRMCRTAADTKVQLDALTAIEITEEFYAEMFNTAVELKSVTLEGIQVLFDERTSAETAEAERVREAEEARRQLEEDQANVRKAMQAQREKAAREEAERVRVTGIREKITAMQMKPLSLMGKPAADVQTAIDELSAFEPDESFAELAGEAKSTASQAISMLTGIHAQAVIAEQAAAIVAEKAKKDEEAADEHRRVQAEAESAAAAVAAAAAHEAELQSVEKRIAIDQVELIDTTPTEEESIAQVAADFSAGVMVAIETDPDFREVADEVASNDEVVDTVIPADPYTPEEQALIEAVRNLYGSHGPEGIKNIVRAELAALSLDTLAAA